MTLNQQEKRNAILVDFSKCARKTTKLHYDNMLKKVFPTDKARARRVIDEYIVAMAIYAVKGAKVSIQAAEKNKAYETKSSLNSSVVMKKVDNVISNFAKFVKKNVDNKMKNHSTLFNTNYHISFNVIDKYLWVLAKSIICLVYHCYFTITQYIFTMLYSNFII